MQDNLNKIFSRLAINQELLSHSLRTAYLCLQLMRLLPKGFIKISPAEMYLAGLLHDLGKASWPKEFFYKSKKELSKCEIAQMNEHPIKGALMAMDLLPELSDEVCYVIMTHHERPDGTGYPTGLKEVSNETLLLATCDVFCACMEPRQYRREMLAFNETIKIIKEFAPIELIEALILSQNKIGMVGSMIR